MSAPTVTVVIPTHARAAQLEACLGGVAKLNSVPGGFEIVVVDDGGPQSLEPLIASWRDRLPVRLTVREQGGPAKARNTGAEMARGRFLAFIDDDCVPLPGWLSALVRELERRPDHLLGGRVTNGLPDDPYATATQSITTFARHYYRSESPTSRSSRPTTLRCQPSDFATSADSTPRSGVATAEDREFCDRWRSLQLPDGGGSGRRNRSRSSLDVRELPPATLQLWARHPGGPSHSTEARVERLRCRTLLLLLEPDPLSAARAGAKPRHTRRGFDDRSTTRNDRWLLLGCLVRSSHPIDTAARR